MVRDQGGNRLSQIRKDFAEGNKAKAEKDLVSLYLQNEKTRLDNIKDKQKGFMSN